MKRFGDLLKTYRLAAGWSREELADRAHLSVRTISALEQGSRQKPYRDTIAALAGALALGAEAHNELERAALRRSTTVGKALGGLDQNVNLYNRSDDFARNNLPPQLTSFIDREQVVAAIKDQLQTHRLVTLVGAGGSGKTRCALEVAAELLDSLDDGVWLAELAPISDPVLVGGVIARALSVQELPNRPVLDALLAYLKRKRLLLILDNCEHVIDEARRVVAAIVHACPEVHVLATSRESFAIAGERTYRMPSLPVPPTSDVLSAEEMTQYGAVQLFADRAAAADDRFSLSVESAAHVAEICRRLDGIPLAIELAAARVKMLSPQQLAQKLDERFHVLTAGDRSALPRHRTMRALIDWSYDLLTKDERRLFRKLAIFPGDFSLDSAEVVCNDETIAETTVLDLLSSLVDKSLVQVEEAGSVRRYRLLESTRQYVREKLVEAGEYDAVAYAHATTFLLVAEELERCADTMPERLWDAQAERESENFRAAINWALGARGDVLLGQRLMAMLLAVWRQTPADGWRWIEVAQNLVDAQTPLTVLAALDFTEAWLDFLQMHYGLAYAKGEQALARYQELGDALHVARAQFFIGQTLVFLDDDENAKTYLLRALGGARELGARKLIGFSLQKLGAIRGRHGDLAGARALFADSLANYRAVGADRTAAAVSASLAEAEFRLADTDEAIRLASASLATYRAFNNTLHVTLMLCNLAAYLIALERYDEARVSCREAVVKARDAQYGAVATIGLQHLAAIAALRQHDGARGDEHRVRAARLLGYVDACFHALDYSREYTEEQEHEKMLGALRDTLGADELSKHMDEGSIWTEDQAVAEAMLI